MCTTNARVLSFEYRIPSVPHKLCQRIWLELLILSRSTFLRWRQSVRRFRNILPFDYDLTNRNSNNYKPTVCDTVCEYVETIAALDGHALSVHVRITDGKYVYPCLYKNNVIALPPQHRITSLYDGFVAQALHLDSISLNTFHQILPCELPHIRVSLRTRGIRDTCLIYRESIRTLAPAKIATKAEVWKCHLDVAQQCRQVYREP